MIKMNSIYRHKTVLTSITAAMLFILMMPADVCAQELPPRPVTVTVDPFQNLSFGAFCIVAAGGTVIIYADGSRDKTGDIVLINLGFDVSAALLEIEANAGTIVSFTVADGTLTSGGSTMVLQAGETSPLSPFVVTDNPPAFTQLTVGGTLVVGNALANPAGTYSGTFEIVFNQE